MIDGSVLSSPSSVVHPPISSPPLRARERTGETTRPPEAPLRRPRYFSKMETSRSEAMRFQPLLLQCDAGDLHGLGPARDFLADEGGKCRRARIGRRLDPGLLHVGDEFRVLEGARKLVRHALDDLLRRAGRRHQAGPG